ncbi:VIT family-domain-containing protein [Chaetomium strumarium]|uniref:VIT family-domain-containing protein n=1 Tax=Chaetomium strumarium TaxID=1170767 RepID=A0AAJ0H580_9PEZI|nr:VIT family-domain-containing protein [Chaetomium strumarium]
MSRVWRPLLDTLGLQPQVQVPPPAQPPSPSPPGTGEVSSQLFQRPTLSRFLADFTLGFADGLTVPFALTAGLSSLGHTDTVIYAGMAEICAGSISMGIGGYLSARGEVAAAAAADKAGAEAVVEGLRETQRRGDRQRDEEGENRDERLPSPLMAGFSVALGYLLGGVLPLFPYFFVRHVKDGLSWSFGVCAVALFLFGFCKDFALSGKPRRMRGSDIRRSAWEGAQMVFLGSVAALAAVLCVRAFEGIQVDHSEQSP